MGASVAVPGPHVTPVQRSAGAGSGRSRVRQILLSLVPIVSAGFLSFVPFLYIALTRRRRQDWLVCAGYTAAVIAAVILTGAGPPDGPAAAMGTGLILLLMGGAATHSFVALRPGGALAQAAMARRAGSVQPGQHAALHAAKDGVRQRARAHKLAGGNPALARNLKIGRPDLERSYDDGGLVDVNHVGAEVLVRYLDLSLAEAEAIIAERDQLGRFGSCAEVSIYANLRPNRLDSVSDLMIFG